MGVIRFSPTLELRIQAFPGAGLQPGRDPGQRHGRFPAQPRGEGQLGGIGFGALGQVPNSTASEKFAL